jgi:hypothetical protein
MYLYLQSSFRYLHMTSILDLYVRNIISTSVKDIVSLKIFLKLNETKLTFRLVFKSSYEFVMKGFGAIYKKKHVNKILKMV